MTSNNSPKSVLSRLIHSDYFDNITDREYNLFIIKIHDHVMKCQHPKCVIIRNISNEVV